ncbi:MAG: DNA polymerase III subunit chi [Alphaproteobacteria bacterium]|nr:DNA polymerase III subunit chi [Alphaproteobacteria bacterium]
MAEIRFYHLQTQGAGQALTQLAARAYEGGKRVVVRLNDEGQLKHLNEALWTFNPNSFIPHGSAQEGSAEDQPVWLTLTSENPNKADTLLSVNLEEESWPEGFELICLMFEGRDETALSQARARWKALKDSGANITYWQQTPQGGWEKKA